MPTSLTEGQGRSTGLVEVLDRVLDKGLVIAGDIKVSLAEVARQAMLKAERDLIIPTLRRVHWNRRKAAPLLGISYKTLLNKIKEQGIVQD